MRVVEIGGNRTIVGFTADEFGRALRDAAISAGKLDAKYHDAPFVYKYVRGDTLTPYRIDMLYPGEQIGNAIVPPYLAGVESK